MIIKVEGLINGAAPRSIFTANPFGWIGISVEIEFPYPEANIEDAYKREALKNTKLFKHIVVKDVKIIE